MSKVWLDQLRDGGFKGWFSHVRTGLEFFTRLPLPAVADNSDPGELAEAARAFPLAGATIGFLVGAVYAVALWLGFTPWLGSGLAVAAGVALTGALHEDGLSDVADGFGGGATPEAKLAIMRDSRMGTYGVAALSLTLVIRVAALAALGDGVLVVTVLIAAGAISRTAMAAVMEKLEPARTDGLGSDAGRPEAGGVIVACGIALIIAMAVLGPTTGFAASAFAALAAAGMAALARRQIGGQTGDILGAVQQVAEITFLLAMVALTH